MIQSKRWAGKETGKLKRYGPTYNRKQLMKLFPNRTWNAINLKVNKLKIDRRQFSNKKKVINLPKHSQEFAWWLGALAGDGYVDFDRIRFKVTDKDFAEKFESIGEQLFLIKSTFKKYLRYDPQIKRKLQYIVSFSSQNLSEYLGDWSHLKWSNTLTNKFDWILKDKMHIAAFLSGYFDAEGSVVCKFHKKQHLFQAKYTAQPLHIKEFLHQLLNKIDIENSIFSEGVMISGLQNLKKFARLIKSSVKQKRDKLDDMIKVEVKYEKEYKQAYELKKKNIPITKISTLLNVPKSTLEGWFYKNHKPNQILKST